VSSSHRLTYEGDPALAGLLAGVLEDHGLRVRWDPPGETRAGRFQLVAFVAVPMVVTGREEELRRAIARFCERFPAARVAVEGDEAEP
jgi:hypothetical protein